MQITDSRKEEPDMSNTDKYFDDLEMLEGGSPADVGLDATRNEDELTLNEREELEALRAFKSYFDDCMVGQSLNIENFHMNGELEPFDNFYASAMEEYHKAIDKDAKVQSDIDFHNTVDSTAEIMTDDGKVNVMLYLTDAQYEAIVKRTDCETDLGASFANMLHDDNTTMNVYVDVYPNLNVVMTLAVQSDTYGWKDYEVLLDADEKDVLRKDVTRAAAERYGLTLEALIEEATENYVYPVPKIESTVAEFASPYDETCAIQQYPNGMFYNQYGYDSETGNSNSQAGGFQSYAEALDTLHSHRTGGLEKVAERPEITQYSEYAIEIVTDERRFDVNVRYGAITSVEAELPPYSAALVGDTVDMQMIGGYLKAQEIAAPTYNAVEIDGKEFTVWAFNPEKLEEIVPFGVRMYEETTGITPEIRQQAVQSYKHWAGDEREEKIKERLPEPKKKSSDERDDR